MCSICFVCLFYFCDSLPKPMHVTINHLCVANRRREEVVCLGITEKFREKYFTTVFYKPIQSHQTVEGTNMESAVKHDYFTETYD